MLLVVVASLLCVGRSRSILDPSTASDLSFKVTGSTASSITMVSVGDVNADGLDDLLVGSPNHNADGYNGRLNLLFGTTQPMEAGVDVGNSTLGITVTGTGLDLVGWVVGAGGDLNGDGHPDFMVGTTPAHDTNHGFVALIWGRALGAVWNDIDIATMNSSVGIVMTGSSSSMMGYGVDFIGDFNGDGLDDLALRAPLYESAAGALAVVFGNDTKDWHSFTVDESTALMVVGAEPSQLLGGLATSSIGVGDFNNDGLDDIAFAQPTNPGAVVYLLLGNSSWSEGFFSMDTFVTGPSQGMKITASFAIDYDVVISLDGAGDMNADGYHDLLLGSYTESGTEGADSSDPEVGAVYVVFGGPDMDDFDLGDWDDSSNGFKVAGYNTNEYGGVGAMVQGLGDIDGDSIPDIAFTIGGSEDAQVTLLYGTAYGYTNVFLNAMDDYRVQYFSIDITRVANAGKFSTDKPYTLVLGYPGDTTGSIYGFYDFPHPAVVTPAPSSVPSVSPTWAPTVYTDEPVDPSTDPRLSFTVLGSTRTGTGLAAVGDVNGDGLDDMLVSSPQHEVDGDLSGQVHLIFGTSEALATTLNVSDAAYGISITGTGMDNVGWVVAGGGDLNGDGKPDLVVCPLSSYNTNHGLVAVLWGRDSADTPWSDVDISTMDAAVGIRLEGESSSRFGYGVDFVGDFNGDGVDDLAIRAPLYSSSRGAVYVVFGSKTRVWQSMTVDSSNSLRFKGPSSTDGLGGGSESGIGIGDYNNDDIADLGLHLTANSGETGGSGTVYVVLGGTFRTEGELDMGNFVTGPTTGHKITGAFEDYYDVLLVVDGAGDLNNDGYDDFLLGSATESGTAGSAAEGSAEVGAVYVIFGQESMADFDMGDWDEHSNGFKISGYDDTGAYSLVGCEVRGLGDLDGDSFPDFAISTGEWQDGQVTLVYGSEYPYQDVFVNAMESLRTATFSTDITRVINAGKFTTSSASTLVLGYPGGGSPSDANDPGVLYGFYDFSHPRSYPTTSPTPAPSTAPSVSPTLEPSMAPSLAPTMEYCTATVTSVGDSSIMWTVQNSTGDGVLANSTLGAAALNVSLVADWQYVAFLSDVADEGSITLAILGGITESLYLADIPKGTHLGTITCAAITAPDQDDSTADTQVDTASPAALYSVVLLVLLLCLP